MGRKLPTPLRWTATLVYVIPPSLNVHETKERASFLSAATFAVGISISMKRTVPLVNNASLRARLSAANSRVGMHKASKRARNNMLAQDGRNEAGCRVDDPPRYLISFTEPRSRYRTSTSSRCHRDGWSRLSQYRR